METQSIIGGGFSIKIDRDYSKIIAQTLDEMDRKTEKEDAHKFHSPDEYRHFMDQIFKTEQKVNP